MKFYTNLLGSAAALLVGFSSANAQLVSGLNDEDQGYVVLADRPATVTISSPVTSAITPVVQPRTPIPLAGQVLQSADMEEMLVNEIDIDSLPIVNEYVEAQLVPISGAPAPMMIEPMMIESAPAIYEAAPISPIGYEPVPAPMVSAPVSYSTPAPYAAPVSHTSGKVPGAVLGGTDGGYGESQVIVGGNGPATKKVSVYVSKASVVNLPVEAADIIVADPTSVTAILRTSRQIVLLANKVGNTNIFFFDENDNQILDLELTVDYDLRSIRQAVRERWADKNLDVETVLGQVIVSGGPVSASESEVILSLIKQMAHASAAQAAAASGATVPPLEEFNVISKLNTLSDDQVMLKVTIAEMRRNVAKQFGVNWSYSGNIIDKLAGAVSSTAGFGVNGGFSSGIIASLSKVGNANTNATLRAFEKHGLMRTLAEPTLTAVTGEKASFLAGGEFPYPTGFTPDVDSPNNSGTLTYSYKEFGVALEFTPVVIDGGRISLHVATEVSELTSEGSLDAGAVVIPGISVRRAESTIELPSGGTMSIAGLIQQRYAIENSGIPGLKNIPVLGRLFSSTDFLKSETELVILVTPYLVKPAHESEFILPTDGFEPASDHDMFLLGHLHKVHGSGRHDAASAQEALRAPLGFIIN